MMKSDCDRCIHAGGISGYEDGQDMFVCGIEDSIIEEYHNYKVDEIDHVYIACSCGFTFFSNTAYDFHNKKWFEEFRAAANRRA